MAGDERGDTTAIVTLLDRMQLGNGRKLMLLTLNIRYIDAIRFAKPEMILRLATPVGEVRELTAILERTHPINAPACIAVDEDKAADLTVGSTVTFLLSRQT